MLFGFGWDLVYNTFLILIHSSTLLLTLSLYPFNPPNRFQLIVSNIHLNYPVFFSCLQIPHFSFFFFLDPFIWASFFSSLWSIYFLIIFSSSLSSSPSISPLMLYILLILYLHVFFFRFSSLLLFISSSFFLVLFFSFLFVVLLFILYICFSFSFSSFLFTFPRRLPWFLLLFSCFLFYWSCRFIRASSSSLCFLYALFFFSLFHFLFLDHFPSFPYSI